MTATDTLERIQRLHVCRDWLPVTVHDGFPTADRDRVEWGIESAVRVYTENDDDNALDVIRVFRPDLTLGEISERVIELCRLSCEVIDLREDGKEAAADVAFEDYRGFLFKFGRVAA